MAEDREQAIEAISEFARGTRARSPRWLWVLALGIGAVCAAAFVVVLVSGGDDASVSETLRAHRVDGASGGAGFTAGLAVGGIAGLALGLGIARQRRR